MSLKPAALLLHRQLLDSLHFICTHGNKDLEKLLTDSIFIAEQHLTKLYELIPADGFSDMDEEIFFFKKLKPMFASEKEYHQRLYHCAVFGNPEHEFRRMEKLLAEHQDFAAYYHSNHTHFDIDWFTQGQAPFPTTLCMDVWETNPRHTSRRDSWVSGLVAIERYRDWLKTRIAT